MNPIFKTGHYNRGNFLNMVIILYNFQDSYILIKLQRMLYLNFACIADSA